MWHSLTPRAARQGEHFFKPDVGIKAAQPANGGAGSPTSVLEQSAVDMEGQFEEEFREVFLEIHEVAQHLRLVTGIEILSPTNKRHGTVGWYQYERKRKVFLEGHANLVEIDMLRGGRRMGMTGDWPDSPYYFMVLRRPGPQMQGVARPLPRTVTSDPDSSGCSRSRLHPCPPTAARRDL